MKHFYLRFLRTSLVCLVFLTSRDAIAQSALERVVVGYETQKLEDFLRTFEKANPVRFYFRTEWIAGLQYSSRFNGRTLGDMLDEVLLNTGLRYAVFYDYAVVILNNPGEERSREIVLEHATRAKKQVEAKEIGEPSDYKPGRMVTLTGTVSDEADHPLAGASVTVHNSNTTAITDERGGFQIALTAGRHILEVQHLNFESSVIDLSLFGDGSMAVNLLRSSELLDEIVVTGSSLLENRIGQSSISLADLKRLPTFAGERDLIKHIQTQPGVSTVGEVASGFNVRGGSPDQNLVLYDGIPVFNTSHALGFFTVFNSDILRSVSLMKGSVPASYGGRISSVLDIQGREGDRSRFKVSGGIGIISSNIVAETPVSNGTGSVIASFRSSYSDWMLKALKSNYKGFSSSSLRFYDGSFKWSQRLGKDKVSLSGYTSHDDVQLASDTAFQWNNMLASARYDRIFNDRLFASFLLGIGRYAYKAIDHSPGRGFNLTYGITYPSLGIDFVHEKQARVMFGFQSTLYRFEPGTLRPGEGSTVRPKKLTPQTGWESALYVSGEFAIHPKLSIEAGVRLPMFRALGPSTVYRYHHNAPREVENVVDSIIYRKNETIAEYYGVEPRVSVAYATGRNSRIKFGYQKINQFIHLISNTAAITPLDVWQPSNTFFKPQTSDQLSAGFFLSPAQKRYEIFLEGFYKSTTNILDYKDGSDLIMNDNLETAILPGVGNSYGIEFSVEKQRGRLTGNINYTYSRSLRKTGMHDGELTINNGRWYPSNYDQPHVLNLQARYQAAKKVFITGSFAYHTGRPVSFILSGYTINDITVRNFSERNQVRIPDYHRFDVAVVYEGNHRIRNRVKTSWGFSLYNVYARKNAYAIFFSQNADGEIKAYKLAVLGTIIPSVTLNFNI